MTSMISMYSIIHLDGVSNVATLLSMDCASSAMSMLSACRRLGMLSVLIDIRASSMPST